MREALASFLIKDVLKNNKRSYTFTPPYAFLGTTFAILFGLLVVEIANSFLEQSAHDAELQQRGLTKTFINVYKADIFANVFEY
jgi:hypothetical protein